MLPVFPIARRVTYLEYGKHFSEEKLLCFHQDENSPYFMPAAGFEPTPPPTSALQHFKCHQSYPLGHRGGDVTRSHIDLTVACGREDTKDPPWDGTTDILKFFIDKKVTFLK